MKKGYEAPPPDPSHHGGRIKLLRLSQGMSQGQLALDVGITRPYLSAIENHGIPRDRVLDEHEIAYLTKLVVMYVLERMPYLTENGERVPNIRCAA